MTNAILSAYVRSPFTLANKGALADVRPDDLGAAVVDALLAKSGVSPELIEDLLIGCAFPEGEQGFNVARMIGFLSGLPNSTGGATINRWCGSSMNAIHMAVGNIASGSGEAFICGGVESMTRVPMGGFNPLPNPDLYERYPQAYIGMGDTAENLAKMHSISREQQEQFALESHQKTQKAIDAGHYTDEIVEVAGVSQDGCVRADTTLEKMASLAPAFDQNGTVTAATSSPVTDGATATLIVSEAFADKHGLPKLARIKGMAVSGCDPEIMGIGPVRSSQKALERAGISLGDVDVIELNEAFAAQSLAVIKELGIDTAKLNIDGGAIAIGHPLGASGARVTGKAAQLLKREGGKYALATMCIGGGQGIATVLEAI